MKTTFRTTWLAASAMGLLTGCSSGPPPKVAKPTPAPSAAPAPPSAAETLPPDAAPPRAESKLRDHLEEDKAAQHLKADFARLLQIGQMSPKTHRSLLKNHLWKPVAECADAGVVEVKPAPGLFVAKEGLKVRAKVYDNLKAAGAIAKQRGTAIEVMAGQATVRDAIDAWNHAVIDAALRLVKAAAPADQKEKSFAAEAKAAVGDDRNPKLWDERACDAGQLGGWSVDVQLVSLSASGGKGQTLVKGGPDGERFTEDTLVTTYWDKPLGKHFRMLTEIMSAGHFIRQCSAASRFFTSPIQDGTWRCREGSDSWDPPNRPIPAWQ